MFFYRRHINSHKAKENIFKSSSNQLFQPVRNIISSSSSQELFTVTESNMSQANFEAEFRITDSPNKFKCDFCEIVMPTEESLIDHMEAHLANAHRCSFCSKAFISQTALINHSKIHHSHVVEGKF